MVWTKQKQKISRSGKTPVMDSCQCMAKPIQYWKVISFQKINKYFFKKDEGGGGKKRSGKNTQKNYTKEIFITQKTMMVWSLTKSQTSWNAKSSGPYEASLQTKLVEVMEFQLSYFKSKKMMLWKCCTQYASKFGKLSSGHRTGKGQFSFQSQRKEMPKNAQTTAQLHSSHTLVK